MLVLTLAILVPLLLLLSLRRITVLGRACFNFPLLPLHTQRRSRSDRTISNLGFGIVEVTSGYFESATLSVRSAQPKVKLGLL